MRLRRGVRPWAMLLLDGSILMDSDSLESERALAARGLSRLRGAARAKASPGHAPASGGEHGPVSQKAPAAGGLRILVAGLGLGITLRELLGAQEIEWIDVIEIMAPLVEWNRGVLTALNGDPLADPRVHCRVADLRAVLLPRGLGDDAQPPRSSPARPMGYEMGYDLMLFDIDNGPGWLSRPENAWLYRAPGLAAVRAHLRIGGWASYWSSEPDADFEAVLAAARWGRWMREPLRSCVTGRSRVLTYHLYWLKREA
ncbi:MAG: hypothetical protein GF330_14275 [Candidatus Eisenbacteria bacterium]|nr:hypothetical protein [Candidatus Eisenbacteria bacterium]